MLLRLLLLVLSVFSAVAQSGVPTKYRYLRALPSSGIYNPGGVYSEYLRALRLKTKLQIEAGFVRPERATLTSFYLAPTKLVVDQCDFTEVSDDCEPGGEETEAMARSPAPPQTTTRTVLRGIVPVPIRTTRDDIEPALMAALSASQPQLQSTAAYASSWKGAAIVDRDRGIFDSLSPYYQRWLGKPQGSKDVYNAMKSAGSGTGAASPYHLFVQQLDVILGLKVTGVLLEVADTPNAASLSLGAAVMVAKKVPSAAGAAGAAGTDTGTGTGVGVESGDVAMNSGPRSWILTKDNFKQLTKACSRLSADAKLLDCHVDEALGVHLATGIPVVLPDALYQRVCVDGLLELRSQMEARVAEGEGEGGADARAGTGTGTSTSTSTGGGGGGMLVSAPYFSSRSQAQNYASLLDEARARPPKPVKKLSDISDATTFLSMRVSEKRACLRASGVAALPKPREGPKMVDAVMIPLLDEEVAYEVLRRLGECRGDFDLAAKMEDFESRKPTLARMYNQAVKQGETERAKALIEEFNSLSTLRYDPSNPEEEVVAGRNGAGFDIEDWYWEQRKRVYGIVA